MKYIITSKGYVSKNLTKLESQKDTTAIPNNQLEKLPFSITKNDSVYMPSENALEAVLDKMTDKNTKKAVEILKDKFACREFLKPLFPTFYYKKVQLKNLSTFVVPKNMKLIVKPVKGFFGAGVRIIDAKSDLSSIQKEIFDDIKKYANFYSESVLSQEDVIIEEFVTGEEYAVDMYYAKDGTPVIVNIYHHPIPKHPEYFNVLYYTDKKIFDTFYEKLIDFFTLLNKNLKAHSFAIHAEFKFTNNQLIPIEFNPLRYGGWGLADLTQYAFGFNPFEAFFSDTPPDWKKIWKTRDHMHFGWVLAYNGKGVNLKKQKPNHQKLKKDLGTLLHYETINYKKNPVFAVAYIEADAKMIKKILEMDFTRYFQKIEL